MGQTRPLTILFLDLTGSVAATSGLDPETALERVNQALAVMARAVRRGSGRVDRYLGDGLMALFGYPAAREDDPLRAIAVALEVVEEVDRLGWSATAGVNTGDAYVGRIGSEAHEEVSAIGPAVNLAARLQAEAGPGEVLVGPTTRSLAREAFEFSPRSLSLKGIPEPVQAFVVRGRRDRPERARGIEGVQAELIGRDEEMAILSETLADARGGRYRSATLTGEAGIGKSRLVAELRREAARHSPESLWLRGSAYESTTETPYAPFADLLREWLGAATGEEGADIPSRIAGRVDHLAAEGVLTDTRARELRAPLAHLLGALSPDAEPGSLGDASPREIRRQTFLAVRDLLGALSRRRPTVVVLEDLHWADALSLDLCGSLADLTGDTALLLVCTYRPESERVHDVRRRLVDGAPDRHVHLALEPLPSDAGRALVEALTDERLTAVLREAVLERAQGNPFFVEEIVRHLREQGALAEGAPDAPAVPASVQSVILSRVDRLEVEARQALEISAVIGRVFPRRLLEVVCGPAVDVERSLGAMERHDLVALERVVPEERYAFHHVLARDTVYASLLRGRRRELHLAVARAIEAIHLPNLHDHVEALAHHFERTDDDAKAAEYLALAAERARRAHLNEVALVRLAAARERLERAVVEGLGDEAWARDLSARIDESLGDVLDFVGRHEEAEEAFREALGRTLEGERVRRARLQRKIGASRQLRLDAPEALRAFDAAVAALGAGPDGADEEWWRERVDVEIFRLQLLYFTSSAEELEVAVDAGRPLVESHGSAVQRGRLYTILAMLDNRRTRFAPSAEAVEWSRQARDALQSAGLTEAAPARFNHGFTLLWAGHLAEAESEILESLEQAERIGDVTLQARCLAYLTLLHRRRGDPLAARVHAERTLDVATKGSMEEYAASALAHLAWADLRDGHTERAGRRARDACRRWTDLPGPYRHFAWFADWPRFGAALAEIRVDEAAEVARNLLDPVLQPPPRDVAAALRAGVEAEREGDAAAALERFEAAAALARPRGYL